jgi:hypothetical protein
MINPEHTSLLLRCELEPRDLNRLISLFVKLYNVLRFVVHIEERDLIAREINVYILAWIYAAGRTEPRKIFSGIPSCHRIVELCVETCNI